MCTQSLIDEQTIAGDAIDLAAIFSSIRSHQVRYLIGTNDAAASSSPTRYGILAEFTKR